MHAAVRSAAVIGIDAQEVLVEVDAQPALPEWTIVGLPSNAVRESRQRVVAALLNGGFLFPPRKITVNLAKADTKKEGTAFDLPIALGVLSVTEQLDPGLLANLIVVGELGLDGSIRGITGALPIARHAVTRAGWLIVPSGNVREAALVPGLAARLTTAPTLAALVTALRAGALRAVDPPAHEPGLRTDTVDFADIVGQPVAKRALEIAAAGGHNLYLVGPPGTGKTMLARCLPTILPDLTDAEALDVIAVHSIAGLLHPDSPLPPPRPFRAPHHSVSTAGLIGGGTRPRPGEVTLAHLGVLFLDEILEFPRTALEALRQPLEDGVVTITRVATTVSYPARFTLIAAANPCPCGFAGDGTPTCQCTARTIGRYRARLSGPLADRIDMHVTIRAVPLHAIAARDAPTESSAAVRTRVEWARLRQRARYRDLPAVQCNAQATGVWIDTCTPVDPEARAHLVDAAARFALSARGYHRTLKVARTIADLNGTDTITGVAVREALFFRQQPSVESQAMNGAGSYTPSLTSVG
jgi:magnesium chelatase family protein